MIKTSNKALHCRHLPCVVSLLFVILTLLSGCNRDDDQQHKAGNALQQVKQSGVLRVATRYSLTTYYEGREGFTGLEYDLIQLFAKRLNVKAEFVVPDNYSDLFSLLVEGEADVAAAGLTISSEREKTIRYTPPYWYITEQLIYRSGTRKPREIGDLSEGILEVVSGTSHANTLRKLKKNHPELDWLENKNLNTDGLIYLVNKGLIDYTIADSNQVLLIRRFYPKLYVAFDISAPKALAWAMPRNDDTSLYNEVVRFFNELKSNKTLAQLVEKHYAHTGTLNYVGNCTFRRHSRTRLLKYMNLFEKAAEKYQIDWRLLAAIGYQESHWNNDAVSPSGVKGLMMLTANTAKHLGVKNRLKPEQTIPAAARYFIQHKNRIPDDIPEPDRTWMALAAYNVGFGHLQDARLLARNQGLNDHKWVDVKYTLPLLAEKKWYKQTRHGYARGNEPVHYVENIRNYFDLLVWLTDGDAIKAVTMKPTPPKRPTMSNSTDQAFKIDAPAL